MVPPPAQAARRTPVRWRDRCHRLAAHLAFTATSPPPPRTATQQHRHSKKPLSTQQVRNFVRDGYIVLAIDEVPAEVHRRIYDHAMINQGGGLESTPGPGGARQQELTPSQQQQLADDYFGSIAQSPTIMGAMGSLLGPDYCGSVGRLQGGGAAAGQAAASAQLPRALVATTGDNQHHKDGTVLPIREHRFRSVGYWYYPREVELTMGPTCVLPRSHCWAVDRNTFPHSEERLDLALLPPKSAPEWREALMAWNGFALSMHADSPLDPSTGRPFSGEVPAGERDERISAGRAMLGDPKLLQRPLHSGGEVKLTVPAGSVVIKHADIWHRVSRAGVDGVSKEGIPWRPMFSGAFLRGSEPTTAQQQGARPPLSDGGGDGWGADSDAAEAAVWGANLAWALGGGRDHLPPQPPPPPAAAARDGDEHDEHALTRRLAEALARSQSEVQRVGAATRLGLMSRGGGSGGGALEALMVGLCSEQEATQRAAMYGLSVSGGRATCEALCAAIAAQLASVADEPADIEAQAGTGAAYPWHVITSACFALGECIDQCGEVGAHAVEVLAQVIRGAATSIVARLTALPQLHAIALDARRSNGYYQVSHEADWPIAHRRRAWAAALTAVGFVGHRAVLSGADGASIACAATELLCEALERTVLRGIGATEEPGAQQVRTTNGCLSGLLRRRARSSPAAVCQSAVWTDPCSASIHGRSVGNAGWQGGARADRQARGRASGADAGQRSAECASPAAG